MARIGELLVQAGELTAQQIEQAVRAQVMWGGRIGTNLVELGFIDLDKLATFLGVQHKMPAALARHFERADPELQHALSADIAEKFFCVPLLRAGPNRSQLIIASIAPLEGRAIAIIADDLGIEPNTIIQSIAGELRIRYHLERAYGIARSTRYLRAKGKTIPPFPHFDIDPLAEDSAVEMPIAVEEELDQADLEEVHAELRARLEVKAQERAKQHSDTQQELPVFRPEEIQELSELAILDDDVAAIPLEVDEDSATGRERRRYVHMIDAPAPEPDPTESQQLGRIAIKRVQTAPIALDELPVAVGPTLGEATRAIRRSQDRDRVAELVCETLFRFMMSCDAATMMVVRGDAAMGWKGFNRTGAPVPEIAVPLDQPGLIPRVIERNQTCRLPSGDLGPIDQLVLVSLGAQRGDLVVVPVSISNTVMCVIAMSTQHDANVATAESVAAAAGAAFARLMRNASR